MSRRKTERLLGLVVCLLSTRRYLTAEQIRQAVPGYPEQDEAFKRMFERDKEELRDLGIPLETGINQPGRRRAWATGSARRPTSCPRSSWSRTRRPCSASPPGSGSAPSWPGAAAGALLKLRAAGIEAGDDRRRPPRASSRG